MKADQTPIITNINAAVQPRVNHTAGVTLVRIESDLPVKYVIQRENQHRLRICLSNVRLRMPDGLIKVQDGLLDEIALTRDGNDLGVTLTLRHATSFRICTEPGIPARFCLALQRSPLWQIMHGRAIVVDPGHGGEDVGGRGPIDLLEKDMTLAVAHSLVEQLEDLGSVVSSTRTDDRRISRPDRLALAADLGADAMIALHTGWFADPAVAGTRVYWLSQPGQPVAKCIHQAMIRKLPLPDRGFAAGVIMAGLRIPVVLVEFATLSNPVEEGWLRSCTFHKRTATAIVNGLKDHFASVGRRLPAVE